ncbi:hypothetical protein HK096_003880 [Nowakowskiella sp. JEL0078]|nr:hypothetical protein HK096_003880 [Nowakowskiella sp. JEL0078]
MEIDSEDYEESQSPENTPITMELTLEHQHTDSDMEAAASLTVLAMNQTAQPASNYTSQFLLSPFPNTEIDSRQYLTRAPSSSSANTNFSDLGGSELSTGSNSTTVEGSTNNTWPQPISTEYFRTTTTTPQVYIHPPEEQFTEAPMQPEATRFLGQEPEFFQTTPPPIQPEATTTSVALQQQNHDTPAFRTEDILMAIKLVAYLSKYPALRAALHGSFSVNVFLLVELFTVPSTLTEIRRWAVICMRNAFKRDSVENASDSVVPGVRSLRKCGNLKCGKWEDHVRQFSKCSRCRRSWLLHKHWCLKYEGSDNKDNVRVDNGVETRTSESIEHAGDADGEWDGDVAM